MAEWSTQWKQVSVEIDDLSAGDLISFDTEDIGDDTWYFGEFITSVEVDDEIYMLVNVLNDEEEGELKVFKPFNLYRVE